MVFWASHEHAKPSNQRFNATGHKAGPRVNLGVGRHWKCRYRAERMTERSDDPWHPYPNAPDVTGTLDTARKQFRGIMMAAIIGGGIGARPAVGLLRNLVRLLVRACEEYVAAIEHHVAAVEHQSPNNLIYSSSHWEGCIEALHRCMAIAEVFRRMFGQWAPDDTDMRIEKEARFTDAETRPIRLMRHAVQHIEEELQNYAPPDQSNDPGSGFFIDCGAGGIRFHGSEVSYISIADYLDRLSSLCKWLMMQNPPPGHPLADPSRANPINHIGSEEYRKPFGGGSLE